MPTPPAPNRQGQNCGKPITPGLPCTACGFDPRAGVVRRDKVEQTRGLDALALKFGIKWSFGAAVLMVGAAIMYYFDITSAEETGGSFSTDPLTGILYDLAGKWAALSLPLVFAVIFIAAGFRAISLKRESE
jgi:hypothetical protein